MSTALLLSGRVLCFDCSWLLLIKGALAFLFGRSWECQPLELICHHWAGGWLSLHDSVFSDSNLSCAGFKLSQLHLQQSLGRGFGKELKQGSSDCTRTQTPIVLVLHGMPQKKLEMWHLKVFFVHSILNLRYHTRPKNSKHNPIPPLFYGFCISSWFLLKFFSILYAILQGF